MKNQGLLVHVLRSTLSSGITITDKRDMFVVIGEGIEKVFTPKSKEETLVYIKRNIWGKQCDYCVPESLLNYNGNVSFGGNYVIGDSRFSAPVPVHDYAESWNEYEAKRI